MDLDQIDQQVTDLQNQLEAVQSQDNWSAIEKATGMSTARNARINTLVTQISQLIRARAQLTKQPPDKQPTPSRPRQPSPTPSPRAQDILQYDSNGNIVGIQANPNFYRQVQTVHDPTSGKTLVISPPTAEQLAQDPNAQPTVTVGYTDQDAADLAQREQANRDALAAQQVASQKVADLVNRTKAEIDQAVARGEDAGSIRANRQLDITQAFQESQIANQRAQLAQQALNDYNQNRHLQAQEDLTRQQIQSTKDLQASLDQVTQRGQDIGALNTQYTTQAQQADARLTAANAYTGNVFNLLSKLNADAPPGSDVVGQALPALLNLGQSFFSRIGGLSTPTPPALPERVGGPAGSARPVSAVPTTSIAPDGTVTIQHAAANVDINAPIASSPAPPETGPRGGLDWLLNSAASPIATPANTPPPMSVTSDGTPLATSADVAAAFGRAA